ncbi:MAG: zinc ribbon domain-containing protein [Lentisphaerota bacterium]
MNTNCPHCHTELMIADEHAGDMVACPDCGAHFKAPVADYIPKICPNCRAGVERSHKICVNCGYDFDSGQLLNTRVVRPEEIVPWWLHVLRFIADCYPGLFRPLTLIAFVIFVILFVAIEILALTVLFMGAFVSAFMVAVAGMMVYVQGAAFLGTGFIMDLRNALVEMQGRQMEAFVWLAAAPTLLILSGMLIASKYLVH